MFNETKLVQLKLIWFCIEGTELKLTYRLSFDNSIERQAYVHLAYTAPTLLSRTVKWLKQLDINMYTLCSIVIRLNESKHNGTFTLETFYNTIQLNLHFTRNLYSLYHSSSWMWCNYFPLFCTPAHIVSRNCW